MAQSLRDTAECIGIAGDFSVIGDFFGYLSVPQDLSILTQVRRLQGQHIHMNLIRVGIEFFAAADELEIDTAVQFTRDTYATVNLGVGRVLRFFINDADANNHENIGSDGEAEDLTNELTVDNVALDIFFVLTYSGTTIGLSRVNGPCNKNAKGMDGSVVALEGSTNTTGFVLAHEAGHYLGLDHSSDSNNLMFASAPNGGSLTNSQGSDMRDHCFVQSACD
jgi:hypothetical protein